MIEEKIQQFLDNYNINHEMMECDPDLADTELFCKNYNIPKANSGNAIIVASKKEPFTYSACLVTAEYKLDVNKTVRKLMGVKRLSFATADKTQELTDMMIGGVTIVALPSDLKIYVDKIIQSLDYIVIGGGSRSQKIKLPTSELTKIPNIEFIENLGIPIS